MNKSVCYMILMVTCSCFLAANGERMVDLFRNVAQTAMQKFTGPKGEYPDIYEILEKIGVGSGEGTNLQGMFENFREIASNFNGWTENEKNKFMNDIKTKAPFYLDMMKKMLGRASGQGSFREIIDMAEYMIKNFGFPH